ncbi:WD40/YVTN/BNR-like repeat-containing protein [Flavivirga spongiicola]|uniref:Oxidoreductase n=1 Tax=Flavivirga spongiicola TaxID=421621 RepID=A0ABU7XPP7_9FLAO|nr:oxidoreductase [Flavivirga sp. MEBiC05379]MDO5977736.1 oxidoreductase [Flavivirga sp. MEBiC05379]
MKKVSVLLIAMIVFLGFKKSHLFESRKINSVEIKTIIKDSLLNVRALEIIENTNFFAFLDSNGNMGAVSMDESENAERSVTYPVKVKSDSVTPNFRALAGNSKHGYGLSIGSPALLFKLDMGKDTIVYREDHPKAFYDSIDFWNAKEGIAIGDPTDNCMSIIITRDGGQTWNKLSCDSLPKAKEGEAAFAASDTNIAIVGDNTWVATGGKSSRILYSPDKGKTWEVYNTPIVQGLETTGMYSVDFYDALNGFAIGGDYTKPNDNSANKIKTVDGGKTWELVAQNENPGYRSCVQYIPNRAGKELVAIGFKGIDYSNDSGNSWKHLSDEGFYTIRFLNDSIAYAAGAGRISKLTFRE